MKRILIILIVFVLMGCQQQDKGSVSVLLPDGVTAISLGGLFDDDNIEFTVVAGPDLLTSELTQNNYDIIVAPLTVGAKLFNNESSQYKVYSIITFANLYLISRENVVLDSINDVEGKRIAAFGRNNTPDIMLKLALNLNGVNCEIVYEGSVNEVISNRFKTNEVDYILVAEPILTNLEENMGINLNIVNLENEIKQEVSIFPQAAIFIKNKQERITEVINKIEQNINLLNSDPTIYTQSLMLLDQNKYPTFYKLGEEVIKKSIPRSNIDFRNAYSLKDSLDSYFNVINQNNPNILGEIPSEDFYIKD